MSEQIVLVGVRREEEKKSRRARAARNGGAHAPTAEPLSGSLHCPFSLELLLGPRYENAAAYS